MQAVFDPPVLADGSVPPLGIGRQACNVVADFCLSFAGGFVISFRLNAHQAL
jgi:hypothetical protein